MRKRKKINPLTIISPIVSQLENLIDETVIVESENQRFIITGILQHVKSHSKIRSKYSYFLDTDDLSGSCYFSAKDVLEIQNKEGIRTIIIEG